MRRLLIALCPVPVLVALACADAPPKTARERQNLIGPVRSIRIDQVSFSRRDGTWVPGPRLPSYITRFTVDGHQTGMLYYGDDGCLRAKRTWLYDEKGNEVEQASYNPDRSLDCRFVKLYDAQGRLIQQEWCGEDGVAWGKEIYTYDAAGHVIETAHYDTNPDFYVGKVVTKYDASGRWIEAVEYDSDGTPGMKQTRSYDAQGRLIEEVDYRSPHDVDVKIVHRYNPEGQHVEESSCPEGAFLGSRDYYTYDKMGNLIRDERWLYEPGGTVTGKWVGVYDARGHETDDLWYGPDGAVKRHATSTYEFDATGNWTKQTVKEYVVEGGKVDLAKMTVNYQAVTYYDGRTASPATPQDD
ncbi:MAG: hypothetical protein JSV65_05150 [Armatimonadota bacterium]|nr:MAG: hypothetical protein JSV65_05150 [Armatimonadota bacterium]